MYSLECQYCHKKFSDRDKDKKFCARECYALSMKGKPNTRLIRRKKTTCNCCGKEIERIPSGIGERNFCSVECRNQVISKEITERGIQNAYHFQCAQCGSSFSRGKGRASPHSKIRFCSKACWGAYAKEHKRLKRDNPNFTSVEVQCAECGKTILRPPYRAKNEINNFCDMNCYAQWRSKNIAGEAHPIWKGGRLPYYGPDWERQSAAARKRDNYRCQCCGLTQKENKRKLDVHHLKPFREFGYIAGENDNYQQANELTNLISLCRSCHKRAEHGHIPIQPKLI